MNTDIDEVEKSHMNGIDQISNKIIKHFPKLRTDILRYKQHTEKQIRPEKKPTEFHIITLTFITKKVF